MPLHQPTQLGTLAVRPAVRPASRPPRASAALARRILAAVLALVLAAPALLAQSGAVTRRDLAEAYLTVDRLAMTRGVPERQRAEWNRAFDRTTLAFFGGDFPRVLREMHDLIAKLSGDSAVASPTRNTLALRLRAAPRVLVSGRDRQLEAQVAVMYTDPTLSLPRTLSIRLRAGDGRTLATQSLTVPAAASAGTVVNASFDPSAIINAPGRYTIEATLAGSTLPLVTEVFVLAEPADSVRVRLLRALQSAPATANAQAIASARARIGLIVETPDDGNSAQFIADPAALASSVEREVQQIVAGRNPYDLRLGDTWRSLQGPAGEVPFRLYAPREVGLGSRMPVVFALHGAGADENMFLEGYGNGRLRALADSVGFILVSPNTTALMRDIAAFDSLVAMLEREYVVDRNTMYVLGHSMGGAAAVRLATERRNLVRAAAVIAGVGAPPPRGEMSTLLMLGAEVDLVVPAARVYRAAQAMQATGATVEYDVAMGWGHTLIVGARLDAVVRWLFER